MADAALSRGDHLLLLLVLCSAGIVVAGDLTLQWYQAEHATWCDVSSYFSCTRVRDSPYSAFAGIPTATVGLGGFALLAGLTVLALWGRARVGPWAIERWLVLLSVVGAIIGLGLSLVEVFVVQAVCILCTLAFGLDLSILAVASVLPRTDS